MKIDLAKKYPLVSIEAVLQCFNSCVEAQGGRGMWDTMYSGNQWMLLCSWMDGYIAGTSAKSTFTLPTE